ncbi:cysteine-rich DPF motif domain-containing protein 1-like [Dendronephthya gigantea]|uniref:cysteine-rich DPF motif domain-containing protein 1-like n=1 Tax=Dendronephthya gigantea TaxID=151771 RepID=UPI001069289D|nr:cysteine-rich DPF motif domain-containing protein 1-like [Dendronephthya gigantea]
MEGKAHSMVFQCKNCNFSTHYDYFGKQPPFCKEIILLESVYVIKDPFTRETGIVILGGHCALCHTEVCCDQKCSVFYSKRFCIPCSMKYFKEFPAEIQKDVQKNGNLGQ